jgi:hypothetical protein
MTADNDTTGRFLAEQPDVADALRSVEEREARAKAAAKEAAALSRLLALTTIGMFG